jgi:hypothetical protein
MGKKQVLDWVKNDLPLLKENGYTPFECIQQQVRITCSKSW